jgi:hypothetical protein
MADRFISSFSLSSAHDVSGLTYISRGGLWSAPASRAESLTFSEVCAIRAEPLADALDNEADWHADLSSYVYDAPESPFSWEAALPDSVFSAFLTDYVETIPVATISDLETIPQNSVLMVIAWVGEQTFRLTSAKGAVSFEVLPQSTEAIVAVMDTVLSTLRNTSTGDGPPTFEAAAAATLYSQLFGSIVAPSETRQTLYVVFLGPLDRVPVNALIVSDTSRPVQPGLRGGVKWTDTAFDVAALPGLSKNVLDTIQRPRLSTSSKNALLFGDPVLTLSAAEPLIQNAHLTCARFERPEICSCGLHAWYPVVRRLVAALTRRLLFVLCLSRSFLVASNLTYSV